ncbi:aminoglycoside phosphotransferase family protein [Ralstonia sp. TCR112]|uniref:aminoglycoside phosphotransferase family protein n=1 Tax=Ralstonia sp. TCR112 TaxID=2601730 RepID=UPI0011BFAF76|nr:aminoglycoside phosphotransferase family protein [Ralstonia sp. TCR112]TXD63280.1 aminoglycoside phosphotransferase family protein [Ralstonia sp. TCR112]
MLKRPKLLWFGRSPGDADKAEAENRQLVLEEVHFGVGPDLVHARGAVFCATGSCFEQAVSALEKYLIGAVDHGLYLYIIVDVPDRLNEVNRLLAKLYPQGESYGAYRVRTSHSTSPAGAHEAPQAALMHLPGPPANTSLRVEAGGVELSDDQRLLLQRAFYDCSAIKLEPIGGGLSGALTFYVEATLNASNAGVTPRPFFAKLGKATKLRDEMDRFKEYAEHHVAWYLRPNFLAERCIYGVGHGILVGSFVEGSKSLWDVAQAGEAQLHIRSLFQDTLGVLRKHTEVVDPEIAGSVVGPLHEYFDHQRLPVHHVNLAKQYGGDVHEPAQLWRKLLNLPLEQWRQCALHGDLHANNVQVRKSDAIIIDFAHAAKGPMCADLASLEVFLAFAIPSGIQIDEPVWRKDMDLLYSPDGLLSIEGVASAAQPWLVPCLQEIRALAERAAMSTFEYHRVLAVYLLRHASYKGTSDDDTTRRAYAYWLANRIVTWLCTWETAGLEAA